MASPETSSNVHPDLPTGGSPIPLRPLQCGLLLLFVFVVGRLGWLSDDAFISFRTVRNLIEGHGLTWNPDERVQAFTHPLWLFLMSAVYFCTHEIFLSAIFTSLAVTAAAVACVLFRLRLDLPRSIAFVALLLLSQAVRDYSTSGLENPLSFLLVAAFCGAWLRPARGVRSIGALFLLGGLLVLNRQDGLLLVAPALALQFWRRRSWRTLRVAFLALTPVLAWELFSLIYYGFPFPNTYYAKLYTGIAASAYREQGLTYYVDLLDHDPATLLIIALGLAWSLTASRRRQALPLALGLLLYLLYVFSIGGDFMQGRFLSVPAFLAAILICACGEPFSGHSWTAPAAAMLVAALALVTALDPPTEKEPSIRANGMANERQFYFADTGLVHYRRDLHAPENHPWAAAGDAMRNDAAEHVFVRGTIGIVGFVAGPRAHIVDTFALADPLLARLPVVGDWRIGHFERHLPEGYLDTLRSGQDHFANPVIARFYDQLRLITRGPLFTVDRWRAIWALNTDSGRPAQADIGQRISVPAARLSTLRPEAYPWDGTGTLILEAGGADVIFGSSQHAAMVSLSCDNNDDYTLEFFNGERLLGQVVAAARRLHSGLVVDQLEVPPTAVNAGWDRVRITPRGGDGHYAVGHLVPLPY